MLRTIFLLWAGPMVLFSVLCGGWYVLSYNNIHFGIIYLTRRFHDHYFETAAGVLNIPAEAIPPMIGFLFLVDLLLIVAVGVLGTYRDKWWPPIKNFVMVHIFRRKHTMEEKRSVIETAIGPMHPAE